MTVISQVHAAANDESQNPRFALTAAEHVRRMRAAMLPYSIGKAGTYGVKLSGDGSTLFVNFNGHATDRLRSKPMRADGFGLCSFAAIHIPESERYVDCARNP